MDSLTQIVLGASVGEAVLGKKVGNKAMLYGAIAGTIPDLDVLASHFTDTVSALEIHRGFTNSIVFSVLFAPIFGMLVSRFETHKNAKDWSWLFFWAFVTHPLLDAHTTWGTQLFWPLDLRLAFKTIFVIDPLYTLPFLTCLLFAMRYKRGSAKRKFYNGIGITISTAYLALTFVLKWAAYKQFENALHHQQVTYKQLDTRPSLLNTILWSANVETEHNYLLASYSFFDSQPIAFTKYPKNHALLGKLASNEKVQQMIKISEGWYIISEENGTLYFSDLRFGVLSYAPRANDFVFKYSITQDANGNVIFTEIQKEMGDSKKLLNDWWIRLCGN